MPLRDHFRAPLADRRSWEGLHGQWPAMIAIGLSRRLPERYFAEPGVHLRASCEIDVAPYEHDGANLPSTGQQADGGRIATAVWAPPLYAAALRCARNGDVGMLETWMHPLALGGPLPTLPLWLADNLAVPLELEPTYQETCRILRLPSRTKP